MNHATSFFVRLSVPLPGRGGGGPLACRVAAVRAALADLPGVGELLVVGDAAEEVLQLVVGHVARADERPPELDHGPHDHQEPTKSKNL